MGCLKYFYGRYRQLIPKIDAYNGSIVLENHFYEEQRTIGIWEYYSFSLKTCLSSILEVYPVPFLCFSLQSICIDTDQKIPNEKPNDKKIKILKLLQRASTRKPFGIVLCGQFFRKLFLVHSLIFMYCSAVHTKNWKLC